MKPSWTQMTQPKNFVQIGLTYSNKHGSRDGAIDD